MSDYTLSQSLNDYSTNALLAQVEEGSDKDFRQLYEERFRAKSDDDYDKQQFAQVCLRWLSVKGDAYPQGCDEAIFWQLRRPTYKMLEVSHLLHDCIMGLKEPRRSNFNDVWKATCLQKVFESYHSPGRMIEPYKETFAPQLQEALLEATQRAPQEPFVVRFPGDDRLHSPSCALRILLALHKQYPNDSRDKDELREWAESMLGCQLGAFTQRELEQQHGLPVLQDKQHRGYAMGFQLSLLSERERTALITSQPDVHWELITYQNTEEVARYAIEGYVKADGVANLGTEDKRVSLVGLVQHHHLRGLHWRSAALALHSSTPTHLRAELRGVALNPNGDYRQPIQTKQTLPLLLPMLSIDDPEETDEVLCVELFSALYSLSHDDALTILDDAYRSANWVGKLTLMRGYASLTAIDGEHRRLDALAEEESDERVLAAIKTAQARSQPDWDGLIDLYLQHIHTHSGELTVEIFSDPLRQRELLRLYNSFYQNGSPLGYGDDARKLRGIRHEPLLMVCSGVDVVNPRRTSYRIELFDQLIAGQFSPLGERLLDHQRELGLDDEKTWRLYEYIAERYTLPFHHHLAFLRSQKGKKQLYAVQKLADFGDEALPVYCENLKAKKADDRMAGIRGLHILGLPESVEPLTEALANERSKKCKKALEEAIDHCKAAGEEAPKLGIYRIQEALDESDALEQLRAILYADATPESWVRCCDLLHRLRGTPSLDVALDYLTGHGLDHWQDDHRILPWGWEEPALQALGTRNANRWTPISTFFLGQQESFLEENLRLLENNPNHKRKLPRHLIDEFVAWIEVAWAWAEQSRLSLSWLEARLDGGCYKGASRPGATHLSLYREFGLELDRGPAYSGHTGKEAIRWIWFRLPKRHPFRDMYPLRSGNKYLDVRDIFGSLDEAREALELDNAP